MFLVWFMFVIAIAIPFTLRITALPHAVADRIVLGVVAVVLAIVGVAAAWRMVAARTGKIRVRAPDPATVAALRWPGDLTGVELEGFCAAFLRGQGWQVAPALSDTADGTFLDARRESAHALLLCDPDGALLRPAAVRSLAAVAAGYAGARPALLTQTSGAFPRSTETAARAARVLLLHVADLPRLAALADAPEPVAAQAE